MLHAYSATMTFRSIDGILWYADMAMRVADKLDG
jgi:hypothetical protein